METFAQKQYRSIAFENLKSRSGRVEGNCISADRSNSLRMKLSPLISHQNVFKIPTKQMPLCADLELLTGTDVADRMSMHPERTVCESDVEMR